VRKDGIVNAWYDDAFRVAVEATGRPQLVMAGVTTDVCLVYPAISAVEQGYDVQAVSLTTTPPFSWLRTPHENSRRSEMNGRPVPASEHAPLNDRLWFVSAGEQTLSRPRTLRHFNMERFGFIDA
jgi:hypothetical protein